MFPSGNKSNTKNEVYTEILLFPCSPSLNLFILKYYYDRSGTDLASSICSICYRFCNIRFLVLLCLIRVYETFVFYSFFVWLVVLYILTCFKPMPLRPGLFVSLKNPLGSSSRLCKKSSIYAHKLWWFSFYQKICYWWVLTRFFLALWRNL